MLVVTCPCLNVKVNLKDGDLSNAPSIDPNSLGISVTDDDFFVNVVKSVQLSDDGITIEHECFVEKRVVAVTGWSVYHCVLCNTPTHAIAGGSEEDNRSVLINYGTLLRDPTTIERLCTSSNYAPSFRVVLGDPARAITHPQMSQCNLGFLPYLQQQLSAYLLQEETATEDRIRKFEAAERSKLADLQVRLKADKKKLISLVLQNSKDSSNPPSPLKRSLSHSYSTPTQFDTRSNDNQRIPKGYTRSPLPSRNHSDILLDDDDELFHMEGNDEPFDMSEDDAQDTDDSSALERSSSPCLFSSSVPVNVPVWRSKNAIPITGQDLEDDGDVDSNQIHANIQALAKSVHESSTEIFGDLPRPRINTFSGRLSGRFSKR